MAVPVIQSRAAELPEILERQAVVTDGAMGTMLLAKRGLVNRCLDELNLSLPALVRDVHQEYLRAGAGILRTNTFGANRKRLEAFGFGDKVRAINQAGARIAREAAREQAFVAGTVGPLGVHLQPLGTITAEEARALFREQIIALVDAGVDLLMLETFRDLGELREAIAAARDVAGPEMIVAAHVSVEPDRSLADGSSPEDYARALDESAANVIGVNCSYGPLSVLTAIEKIAPLTRKPLSAAPGIAPGVSPEYLARYAQRFLRAGARLLGGCCGTTPEHIRAMRAEIRDSAPVQSAGASLTEAAPAPAAMEAVPLERRSGLGSSLAGGRFVAVVEMFAPKGPDALREIEAATRMKSAGVGAFLVSTGSHGQAKLGAAAACQLIQQHAGLEGVLQLAGSRSVQGVQSDLMSLHALGIRNVLLGSASAIHIGKNLNLGLDLGGHPLGSQTALALGAYADLSEEFWRLEAQLRAGADFVITSPVFDLTVLEAFLERIKPFHLPVIAGVRILAGSRDAEYLMHEKGVAIPASTIARLSADGPAARTEAASIARELIEKIRGLAAGVLLGADFNDPALDITTVLGAGE